MTHFFCGTHSNIPICCIMHFINVWKPSYETDHEFPELCIKDVYYVPCPTCVVNIMEGNLKSSTTIMCACRTGVANGIPPIK